MTKPQVVITFICHICSYKHHEHTAADGMWIEFPYPDGWAHNNDGDKWECPTCFQKWLDEHPDIIAKA